jgi:hypothetical protein
MTMKSVIAILLAALSSPAMAGLFEPRPTSPRRVVFSQYFYQYDTNGDNLLSFAEFQGSVGASDVPVVTEYRFLVMGTSIQFGAEAEGSLPKAIFLHHYIRFAGGLKVPRPARYFRFDLADDNRDGFLSPAEYAQTRNAAAATNGSLGKSFKKLDKDGDNQISMSEFGIDKA